ncbi:MAG: Mut7-C RNAse domain-containing protein [Deltaproteobacteria bacterium]|nr:Mut7-C RNAse domain-containing protein [Deltaproteobacteria bacterium]
MAESAVSFAADRMLGRLATWLRLLGFDTRYGPQWSGRALLRLARDEGRVVLTRDTRLQRVRQGPPLLFIESDHFRAQLRQVLSAYQLDPYTRLMTRCARCNEALQAVAKESVAQQVPPYVYATQAEFVRCPHCRRLYWPATHAAHVRVELAHLGYQPSAADLPPTS